MKKDDILKRQSSMNHQTVLNPDKAMHTHDASDSIWAVLSVTDVHDQFGYFLLCSLILFLLPTSIWMFEQATH